MYLPGTCRCSSCLPQPFNMALRFWKRIWHLDSKVVILEHCIYGMFWHRNVWSLQYIKTWYYCSLDVKQQLDPSINFFKLLMDVIWKESLNREWSIILLISTKRPITYHLHSLNTKNVTPYDGGNPGLGLGQAQESCGVKSVNGNPTLPSLY